MTLAYYLELPLQFPEGVHFGGSDEYNSLLIARDGRGNPVLNGSSLAGLLRSLWTDFLVMNQFEVTDKSAKEMADLRSSKLIQRRVQDMFGEALGAAKQNSNTTSTQADVHSCVKVTNYRLHTGPGGHEESCERVFHVRNRHRGTVVKNGLFSIETCPPGTHTTVGLWIVNSTVNASEIELFMEVVVEAFKNGVYVGGKSNRGFGRAVVDETEVRSQRFDLSTLASQAAYLNAHHQWRQSGRVTDTVPYSSADLNSSVPNSLFVELILQIPRGQDILVASGRASEVHAQPQFVFNALGHKQWRLPGSSLRGLFLRWFHRLHAREQLANDRLDGIDRSDAAIDYLARESSGEYTPQSRAWCFQPANKLADCSVPETWHVESLFGSCIHPGRIKISDGYANCSNHEQERCPEIQKRVHVAVDSITGGAAEGFLFDNYVLTSAQSLVTFPIKIVIRQPREYEARWLAQTLVALHLGVLRVGSSKSAGRLEIKEVTAVRGLHKNVFDQTLQILGKQFK